MCADMIVAVLTEAVFIRIGRRVPALSRWSSFSPSLVSQALGFLISLVVPRTRQLVGAATNDDHAQPVPLAGLPDRELSFQEYKSKKDKLSLAFLTDPKSLDVVTDLDTLYRRPPG